LYGTTEKPVAMKISAASVGGEVLAVTSPAVLAIDKLEHVG
jgi:hypothetical protein